MSVVAGEGGGNMASSQAKTAASGISKATRWRQELQGGVSWSDAGPQVIAAVVGRFSAFGVKRAQFQR